MDAGDTMTRPAESESVSLEEGKNEGNNAAESDRGVALPSSCIVTVIKWVSVIFWLAFGVFAFPLPEWSNLLNARFWNTLSERAPQGLCTLDPALFKCTDGQNFTELALAAGRPGCSCGEGILGESLCSLVDGGLSLSSLIGTTTGSGLFIFFSIVPTLNMWLYVRALHYELERKLGQVDIWNVGVLSLMLFQISFALITVFPACIWGPIHTTFSVLALVFLGVHLLIVAIVSYKQLRQSRVVTITLALGIPALLAYVILSSGGSALFQANPTPFTSRLYFYGECIGLFCAFGITPVLLMLGELDDYLFSVL